MDAELQFFDVGDDPNAPAARLQVHQGVDREFQHFIVQAAESLVDEEGVELNAASVALNHVGEAEGEREGFAL